MTIAERWKNITGYEGYYQVSNLGRVRSLNMDVWNGRVFYKKAGRILKPIPIGNYLGVQLCVNKVHKKFYIHRLVAQSFIENPQSKKEVNHINGDRTNNEVTNLEWNTRKENEKHAHETGLKNLTGENNPMCKFSDETIKEIRTLYKTGKYKQSELAKMFGVSRMQTNRIVRNLLRKDVV